MSQKGSSSKKPDYYELLGLTNREATNSEISKAFKQQARKFHPDRAQTEELKKEYEEKFKEISHAYEILTDETKRKIYDKYGEEGLKEGMGSGGGFGMDPFDILRRMAGGGGFDDDEDMMGGSRKKKAKPVVQQLKCTLEDLYQGTSKKIRVTRTRICSGCKGTGASKEGAVKKCTTCKGQGKRIVTMNSGFGFLQQFVTECDQCDGTGEIVDKKFICKVCDGNKVVNDSKVLEVHVNAGAPDGDKIVFEGEADEAPGIMAGDIVFVVSEQPHPLFKRRANGNRSGSHLVMKKKINLLEALTGFEFVIPHLDGRKIIAKSKGVIKPGDVKQVDNEGMPLKGNPFVKGNLFIEFDEIEFPDKLTEEEISKLTQILPKGAEKDQNELKDVNPEDIEEVYLKDAVLSSNGTKGATNGKNNNIYESDDEYEDEEAGGGAGPRVGCAQQ
ncbi:hypothetical protein ABK040_007313 [Willaertia magna]